MTPAATEGIGGRPSGASTAKWRSRAFGLEIEADFPISGLPPVEESPNGRPTTVALAATETLEGSWRPEDPVRLTDSRHPDGRLLMGIDHDDQLGYRLSTDEFGEYHLSSDGRRVQCAPPQLAEWRRERVLTARALPLAATLRGLEVFHASAVSLGDRVAAVVGPSHIGKTSLAVNLVLNGASFVTDDLLALEAGEDEVLAHPGAAVMGIRPAEYNLIEPERRRRLGRFVRRPGKFFAEVEREDRTLPLKIVYFLERRRSTRELRIEELTQPDPRLLLASSFFNSVIRSRERLRAQLDICAQLSHSAVLCRASVPPGFGARALAGTLAKHATERLGTRIGP